MSKKADSTTTEEEIQCRKFDDQNSMGRGSPMATSPYQRPIPETLPKSAQCSPG